MRYIQADYIITACAHNAIIPNGILQLEAQKGTILNIYTDTNIDAINGYKIEKYEGVLCPGFVNTHCHIELSHLKKAIPQHTGLLGFLPQIAPLRNQFSETQIQQAIENAHLEMYHNGIVAVGDIANTTHSLPIKSATKNTIHYHTFIEAFDVQPTRTLDTWSIAIQNYEQFKNNTQNPNCTITPHAPYTVTPFLFEKITHFHKNLDPNLPLTIHNQECKDEDLLFSKAQGGFYDLHQRLQNDTSFYTHPSHKSSIHYTLQHLNIDPVTPLLLVHNTYSLPTHTQYATQKHPNIYWCLCPNANLYIENNLPNITQLATHTANVTIGTDSLASNHKLCLLSEIKTINNRYPTIPLTELLKWATLNGAKALNMHATLGSIEIGKISGINLIQGMDLNKNKIFENATVKKII